MTWIEAKGYCARSGKLVPLNEMVEDGFCPGLLVSREAYEPPIEVPMATIYAEDFSNPAPWHFTITVVVTFPAWDMDAGIYQVPPRCTSTVWGGTITITESGSNLWAWEDGTGIGWEDGTGIATED